VETKNHTLEETAAIFDGEVAREKITDLALTQAGVVNQVGNPTSDDKGSVECVEKS
jgi:hypothetical protein